jgi:drug/metabolite transporter (DMT)-like permease
MRPAIAMSESEHTPSLAKLQNAAVAAPLGKPMSPLAGAACVVAAVILWGVQLPIATLAFARVDPYHLTGIRYGIALVVLVPLLLYCEGSCWPAYRSRFWAATSTGVAGTCISPLLTFVGLSYSQPEHAVVISALQPLMVAIAERVYRGRRLAPAALACIFVAVCGVLLVVTEGKPLRLLDLRQLMGDVLILAGAVAWVVFAMARESFRHWSNLSFTTLTIIPGWIATVIVVVVAVSAGFVPPLASDDAAAVWPQLVYLSFGSALLAMLVWNAGNRAIGALNAMLIINLQPVVTFAVRFMQGYPITGVQVAGAGIVIGALLANTLRLRAAVSRATRERGR